MKELLAFIVMAIVIAVLIEVNERIKAKRSKDAGEHLETSPKPESEDCTEECTDCSLMDVCEKKVPK